MNIPDVFSLMDRYGVTPRRSLGQSFLVSPRVMERIVRCLAAIKSDLVVEIGTGPGVITALLAGLPADVVSIEIDCRLEGVHRELFNALECPPVMLYADAREIREADVFREWRRAAASRAAASGDEPGEAMIMEEPSYILFGNLPYYLTTELILSSVIHFPSMRRAVFMVQEEAVDRLTAGPGSKRYGPLSIVTRLFGKWHVLETVPRTAFTPPPHVTSSLVELVPAGTSEQRFRASDPAFHAFLTSLFQFRRKTIGNALAFAGLMENEKARGNLDAFLSANALLPSVRTESLDPERLAELFSAMTASGL